MENTVITQTTTERYTARESAVAGLAIVGFLALVFLGIVLAIYAARYVPSAVSRLASSVGYLDLDGSNSNQLQVVPTIPFPVATTTATSTATSTAATTTPASSTPLPIQYHTVTTTYPTPGATQIPVPTTYSGLPNLIVSIVSVGYIDSNGNYVSSATSTISRNNEFGAQILVTNAGTNKTGSWNIQTVMPTDLDSSFDHTETMNSLDPQGSVILTLKLTQGHPRSGSDQLQVTVDPNNQIAESDESDNTATATFSAN